MKQYLSFQQDPGIANHESTWHNIRCNDYLILIGAIYRRPGERRRPVYLIKMHDFIHNEVSDCIILLITGDFDLFAIDFPTGCVDYRQQGSAQLLKCSWT